MVRHRFLACMERIRLTTLILGVFICVIPPAWAQPVYKSVDKEGNVTYSSTPPEDAQHVEETGVVSQPSDPNADTSGDIERVKQTAEQLESDRKARESDRAEQKAAAEAQEKSIPPSEQPVVHRQRPIVQQPITPPGGTKPSPLPEVTPPVIPAPPQPGPPVKVPLGSGGAN